MEVAVLATGAAAARSRSGRRAGRCSSCLLPWPACSRPRRGNAPADNESKSQFRRVRSSVDVAAGHAEALGHRDSPSRVTVRIRWQLLEVGAMVLVVALGDGHRRCRDGRPLAAAGVQAAEGDGGRVVVQLVEMEVELGVSMWRMRPARATAGRARRGPSGPGRRGRRSRRPLVPAFSPRPAGSSRRSTRPRHTAACGRAGFVDEDHHRAGGGDLGAAIVAREELGEQALRASSAGGSPRRSAAQAGGPGPRAAGPRRATGSEDRLRGRRRWWSVESNGKLLHRETLPAEVTRGGQCRLPRDGQSAAGRKCRVRHNVKASPRV